MFKTKALKAFFSLFGSLGHWILVLVCDLVLGIWNLILTKNHALFDLN